MPGESHPSGVFATPTGAGAWLLDADPARGGSGAVYRARHASDGRVAAVKILSRSLASHAAAQARFAREIAAARRVQHANVVAVLDDGVLADGRPWFAMEWLDGGSLAQRRALGPLSSDDLRAVIDGVGAGLAAAHAAGIVHRDLKATNVMLATPPSVALTSAAVRLVDFGVAFLTSDERLTSTGFVIGTPASMSPEQRAGSVVTAAADVYALGVLVHELVTGEPPRRADDGPEGDAVALLTAAPQLSPALPAALEPVVLRCLATEPTARGDVVLVAAALGAALAGQALPVARASAGAAFAVALAVTGARAADAEVRRRCDEARLQVVFAGPEVLVAACLLGADPQAARARVDQALAALAPLLGEGTWVRRHEGSVTTLTLDGHELIVGGDLLVVDTWPTTA